MGPFFILGGEGGIRTLDTLLTHTRFPSVRLRPLGHLSKILSFFTVDEITKKSLTVKVLIVNFKTFLLVTMFQNLF